MTPQDRRRVQRRNYHIVFHNKTLERRGGLDRRTGFWDRRADCRCPKCLRWSVKHAREAMR